LRERNKAASSLCSSESEIIRQMVLPAVSIMAAVTVCFYGLVVLLKWFRLNPFVAIFIALFLTYAAGGLAIFATIRGRRELKRPRLRLIKLR